jgi:hypothetical protein
MKKVNPPIIALLGFILAASSILIVRTSPKTYGSFAYKFEDLLAFTALVGVFLFVLGIILTATTSKGGKHVAKITLGLLLIGVGLVMTMEQINGNIQGVYIIGFVPIPILLVTSLGVLAGAYFFISGTMSFFREYIKR